MPTPIPRRPSGPAPLVLTAMALLCVAGVVGAQEQPQLAKRNETVAIVQLPFQGVTREVELGLRQALREALVRGGFDVVPDAEVESKLQRDPQLAACTTRSCLAREALTFGAFRVIEGEVQRPQRSTYRVRLQLRDLRSGQIVGLPEEERCDVCGTEEARQMLVRVATRLCHEAPPLKEDKSAPDTGTLQIESQPLGADVFIDGVRQEDRTPAMFLLPVGVHSLELRAPSHKPVRRPVEIGPGRHATLNLELVAVAPRRPWLTALSGVLLAGAVGLAATSGVLWHYDNTPVYRDYPMERGGPCFAPQAHCPDKYDNRLGGGITAGLAGALLLGGALAIYYDYAPPRHRLVLAPAPPSPAGN